MYDRIGSIVSDMYKKYSYQMMPLQKPSKGNYVDERLFFSNEEEKNKHSCFKQTKDGLFQVLFLEKNFYKKNSSLSKRHKFTKYDLNEMLKTTNKIIVLDNLNNIMAKNFIE